MKKIIRNKYNEINLFQINSKTQKVILNSMEDVKKSKKIDEHGNWEFGKEFDSKGRGSALNWSLYGVSRDYHSNRFLIVIQIRQYIKFKRDYFPQIRKNYFLIGRNEDNSAFAHSVESRVVHNAIQKNKNVVLAVQNWIFQTDYRKVFRQGDFGFVKVNNLKGRLLEEKEILLEKSHKIVSNSIFKSNDTYYVVNPRVEHLNHVHPELKLVGSYKVIQGQRSSNWDFASPTID